MNLAKKIAGLHIQAKSFDRIVYAQSPITSFRNVRQRTPQSYVEKPQGLWYECNKGWKEFVQHEMPSWVGSYNHKYLIEVNLNKMCVIRNKKDFLEFVSKYGFFEDPGMSTDKSIDWKAVSKDYDGIEICPYQWDFRMSHMWYYTWDVASGCIWGSGAFKSLEEVENDIADEEFKSDYDY
tara:strand:+ start:612 stop:1151 length:540 start_codon:yes stop_codon:yes gene_type:complete